MLPICSYHTCTYPGSITYPDLTGAWCPQHDPRPHQPAGTPGGARRPNRDVPVGMEGVIAQCVYCGCDLTYETYTKDHVIPRSRGGGNGSHNIAPSCKTCNNDKGMLTAAEYLPVRGNRGLLKAKKKSIMRRYSPRSTNS